MVRSLKEVCMATTFAYPEAPVEHGRGDRVEGELKISGQLMYADDLALPGNGTLSQQTKIRSQLSACFTAEAYAQAVNLVQQAAGMTGIRVEAGFEGHFRDIHTLTQHAPKSYSRYESVGKTLFGLPQDWIVPKL
jgi:alkylation response protein AidB-like acyl-CoA dehydrogenase